MRHALLLLTLVPGLAGPVLAEEWYDAWDRALGELEQHAPAKAVADLDRAIRLRPEPGQNLITYGTNAVRHYHPYLRLADAYLMLGDPVAAREALRRSQEIGGEPALERASIGVLVESALEKRGAVPGADAPAVGPAQPSPAPDPELALGLKRVETGDFEAGAAILTGVVRRLSAAGHSPELGRAYLYLGIAYIGLSQEERMRASPAPARP
jgi:tetratricopeptide (TPR) repeat protein